MDTGEEEVEEEEEEETIDAASTSTAASVRLVSASSTVEIGYSSSTHPRHSPYLRIWRVAQSNLHRHPLGMLRMRLRLAMRLWIELFLRFFHDWRAHRRHGGILTTCTPFVSIGYGDDVHVRVRFTNVRTILFNVTRFL